MHVIRFLFSGVQISISEPQLMRHSINWSFCLVDFYDLMHLITRFMTEEGNSQDFISL